MAPTPGAELEVTAVVPERGRGTHRVTSPAVGEPEERGETLELAGVPKEQDVMEVLTAGGLPAREGSGSPWIRLIQGPSMRERWPV